MSVHISYAQLELLYAQAGVGFCSGWQPNGGGILSHSFEMPQRRYVFLGKFFIIIMIIVFMDIDNG